MRVVSNIVMESVTAELIVVRSRFVLGEVRSNRQETLFGRNRHVLSREPDRLSIVEKHVFLINNDITMNNVTVLI
jgi:3-phenylpropionate/cinnamic acid dioxygenase small subunit